MSLLVLANNFFTHFIIKQQVKINTGSYETKNKKKPKTPPKNPTTLIAVMSFIAVYQNGLEQ